MKITIDLDDDAATALATIIRRLTPDAYGVDVQAWYRALDALSPQLLLLDEIESRARLYPTPSAAELAYRQRLADELAGA